MKKQFVGILAMALSVLFMLSSTQSLAQQKTRQPAPDGVPKVQLDDPQDPDMIATPPPTGDFVFMATEMSFGIVVKGAPYSAQAITESVQTLSDGNRIVNKSTATVYRDSEGRMRREQNLKAIGMFASGGEPQQTIFIDDPVAGTSYTLDQRTHSAHKMPPMHFKFQVGVPPRAGEGAGATPPPDLPGQFEIQRSDLPEKTPAGPTRFIWGWRNHEAVNESLGRQNIEGVEAEGTRGTVTIPAGEIGNERPIEIVDERWYSAELQTVVMTRHSDPRFGETNYKLTNISRSEQPRSLFEVPADYTVKSGPTSFTVGDGPSVGVGVGIGGGEGIGTITSRIAEISGGVLNGKATKLPLPPTPPVAKAAHASGEVKVAVMIDEGGNVVSARAVAGHPLLQAAAVAAARQAKFSPTKLSGQPVKVQGVLIYNFAE
jgi:TonB family protein